jgi:uncharacterized membrane protein required for colicin V production
MSLFSDKPAAHEHRTLPQAASDAVVWCMCNERKALLVALAGFAFICAVSYAANPPHAQALPILIPIIAGIVAGGGLGSLVFGDTCNSADAALRGLVNMLLSAASTFIASIASSDMLTSAFDQLYPSIEPTIYNIHQAVVIPIADIVLAIFLVVGLGKLASNMGRTESGVDVWQLFMVFVMYALAKAFIDASYELMIMAYNLVRMLIVGVLNTGFNPQSMHVAGVPDDVKNWGVLLFMAIIALGVVFVSIIACAISQIVIIVRAIQIYVYTCFAPLPLAFLVSDSARGMATGFIKRYIALLLSGAIMALLMIMFALAVNVVGSVSVTPDTIEHTLQWVVEYTMSLTTVVAFAWALFKSGSWARDFVGV